MKNKVAILFYGQPRLIPDSSVNVFNLLKKAFLREENNTVLDVYVHSWKKTEQNITEKYKTLYNENLSENNNYIFDFILKEYKPKKFLIEESVEFDPKNFLNESTLKNNRLLDRHTDEKISTFISQIVSVQSVCNLIDVKDEDEYDYYILTRFDVFLDRFDKNEFEKILAETNYFRAFSSTIIDLDIVQIFGKDILNLYKNSLIPYIKHKVFNTRFNPELLRFSVLIDKGYVFYGNLYVNLFPKNYFGQCLKIIFNDFMSCHFIRDRKEYIENILDYKNPIIKPIWFLSSCGFLFFYLKEYHFLVKKLKKHCSYTDIFDPEKHLKNVKITHIKLFDKWYQYEKYQSLKIISDQEEFSFEIKLNIKSH